MRLAYIGVPPIFDDLYPFLESQGARVVFNETQRQFAMPYELDRPRGAVPQLYLPLRHLSPPLRHYPGKSDKRKVDGVIHYVQSFCFRQIEDLIIRQQTPSPHPDPGRGQTDPPRCQDEDQDRRIPGNARRQAAEWGMRMMGDSSVRTDQRSASTWEAERRNSP